MSLFVVVANPATVELSPSPVPDSWVVEGRPQAKATAIARSQDGGMTVIAWSCTRGRFRWHYQFDEMCHILAGEVFITDESGGTRRLGPGDTVFFPSGSTVDWRVTADIRKIAVCRVPCPSSWAWACAPGTSCEGSRRRLSPPSSPQPSARPPPHAARAHSVPASPQG